MLSVRHGLIGVWLVRVHPSRVMVRYWDLGVVVLVGLRDLGLSTLSAVWYVGLQLQGLGYRLGRGWSNRAQWLRCWGCNVGWA